MKADQTNQTETNRTNRSYKMGFALGVEHAIAGRTKRDLTHDPNPTFRQGYEDGYDNFKLRFKELSERAGSHDNT